MIISDEAVDAALNVLFRHWALPTSFDHDVRKALEAAAPHIAAQAWDEGLIAVEAAAVAVYGHQLDEVVREATKARLRTAIEAAAPSLMALAWDEALEHAGRVAWEHAPSATAAISDIGNPYRSQP